MKNNRLRITFNESLRSDINDGYKESYRVKKFSRAQDIIGRMDKSIIKGAVFKNDEGTEFDMLKTENK